MAIPRFSFGAGSNPFYDPNRILVPTQLSAADREKADKFQAESKAYNEAMEKFRREAEAYNAQVEAFNRGLDTAPVTTPSVPKIDSSSSRGGYNPNPAQMFDSRDLPKSTPAPTPSSTVPQFNVTAPVRPADPSFTQADMDAFDAEATARAQQLQRSRQTAVDLFQNPGYFSRMYGIGSLSFEEGGDVPFFLEAEPARSKVPSQEELTKALLRYFPVLQLLNKTSKIYTELVPDLINTSVKIIKNPESTEEEYKNLNFRLKNRADSILNMFGTSTEELMPRDKEPVYKTEFEEGGAVGEGIASLRPSKTTRGLAPYGIRYSGEGAKGLGYFGEITSPSGHVVTEYSLYNEDIGEYPSIVPTLTSEELQDTIRKSSQGQKPSAQVIMKARRYAKDRLSEGKSPFAGPTELRFPVPSKSDEYLLSRIDRFLEQKNR